MSPQLIPLLYQMGMEGKHPSLVQSRRASRIVGTTEGANDPDWATAIRPVQPPAPRPRHGRVAPAALSTRDVMTKERLYLFDTTLRDGAQTAGIEFSLEDKISVAALLEELGVDYIEGGYPGANVVDDQFFAEARTTRRHLHRLRHDQAGRALGRQRPGRAGHPQRRVRCRLLCRQGLGDSRSRSRSASRVEENLESLRETVEASVAAGKETLVDCEHFFDGYKAQPGLRAALRRDGARRRRPLGRALRHQWRHHALRGRRDRRARCSTRRARRQARHPCP